MSLARPGSSHQRTTNYNGRNDPPGGRLLSGRPTEYNGTRAPMQPSASRSTTNGMRSVGLTEMARMSSGRRTSSSMERS
eukprot:1286765-Pyramimonas_sp.AAC.2